MLKNAPAGSDGAANPSGWMNGQIFLKYLEHFSKCAPSSKESPILLICDNHESHISIEVINFAREKGIVMLTIPPHCSHKLQPLDVGVFYSFKVFVGYEHDKWLLNNPGKTITIYEIAEFVKNAYSTSFTGICEFNRNIFTEVDYLSSAVTDRPNPDTDPIQDQELIDNQDDVAPTANRENDQQVHDELAVAGPSSSQIVSPEVVRPLPKAEPKKKKQCGRKPGKSRVLTDTPEKKAIENSLREKQEKIKQKEEKKILREEKKKANENKIEMTKGHLV